jgi:hypothetical protein
LMLAGPDIELKGARLIAIAKERLGHEEFLKDHWNKEGGMKDKWLLESDQTKKEQEEKRDAFTHPELYYDTWKDSELPGTNPLFRVTNGDSMGLSGVMSYLFNGVVAKSNARVETKKIKGDMKGEGKILGSVLVINRHGDVLLHHKEQSWGDHPDDEALYAAINQLDVANSSL